MGLDKHISESARAIREMFGGAEDHKPFTTIFMDEIDAIADQWHWQAALRGHEHGLQNSADFDGGESSFHFCF